MNDTAGRERRAAARFTELVLNGLYEDCQAGGEFASEVMYEALHEVRNEFGNDDLELRDLIQPPTHPASAAAGSNIIDEGYLVQAIAAETANLALTQQRLEQINDEWRSLNEQRQNAITQVTRLKARKGIVGQMLDELRAAAESAEASGDRSGV